MNQRRSSALFVPYEIRPSKQLERRIFLDVLMRAMLHNFSISSCRYVGNGGTKFHDFIMFHRMLGLCKLVSVEGDKSLQPRCHYNKPLDYIEIYEGEMNEFFDAFISKSPHIVWFDSDDCLVPDVSDVILTIGTKLPEDSFFFFTASAEPPKPIRKANPKQRMQWYRDNFKNFASDFDSSDFADGKFRFTTSCILNRIVSSAFNARPNLIFTPLVKLLYKDSTWMMSIGGVLTDFERGAAVKSDLDKSMPFLLHNSNHGFYQIPQFNISEQERMLLDRIATQPKRLRRDRIQANKLGFDKDFISEYEKLLRYIPRYFESFI